MRRSIAAAFVVSAAVAASLWSVRGEAQVLPAAPPAATQPVSGVPVKAVVLFSSGVGYFEHFGVVRGAGTTELRFKTQQVNDILKSLVLQDVDGGKVTAVNYPSLEPIGRTLKSFQVDITSNPGLGELLNQLRGAAVKLSVAGEMREGTILGLERKQTPKVAGDKSESAAVWVMNLVSKGHIRSVYLDQMTDIELQDPRLQEELDKALVALSQARDQDKKPVTIHFDGQGERHVRIGYVVETPIWKTSYRLVLGKKHQLQGWALVENETDNDWKDVQLSLVSGRPISFMQNLYQPLYVPRPLVRPEQFVSLRPQTYEAGIDAQKNAEKMQQGQQQLQQMQQAAQNQRGGNGGGMGGGGGGGLFGNSNSGKDETAMDPTSSIASIASASKVGELFQYTVGNVSLPRQQSAMIPIITDPIEVERLSIYNVNVLGAHPLYGARLTNTTGKHLLAGPITVLDRGSYAGDASIDNVPPGQSRLVSYGIDLEVMADPVELKGESHIETAKLTKGMLETSTRTLQTSTYMFQNKGDRDRTLIVEHGTQPEVELVDTEKPIEKTESLYRFKHVVEAGKTWKFVVKEQSINSGQVKVMELDDQNLQLQIKAEGTGLPQPIRGALAKIIERRAAIAESERKLKASTQHLSDITGEQQRIRENMKTVNGQQNDYYTRLLKKLNDQETLIEKVQGEAEETRKQIEAQRKELDDYVQKLDVR